MGSGCNTVTNRVYVTNYGSNTLSVIDGSTNNIISTINVGGAPQGVAVDLSTNRIYVTNGGSGTVSVIDGSTDNVIATVNVGTSPIGVAVNTSTHFIYVTNFDSNNVYVINGSTSTVVAVLNVGKWPQGVDVNPNTNLIYVAIGGGDIVSVIDGSTNSIVTTVNVGNGPWGVAVNSNTNRVYVANEWDDTVSIVQGGLTNTTIATVNTGNYPWGIALNPNTSLIYVTNESSSNVSVIQDTSSQDIGLLGNGQDGALIISSNITDNPIDSNCTGTAGSVSLSANNPNFTSGQVILIDQSQGVAAGQYERNVIQSYAPGTITVQTPLAYSYTTGAQVLVLKQYTNVTVYSGATWTAKAWNGTTGGILAFLANGSVNVQGTISSLGRGFAGGLGNNNSGTGYTGEGYLGLGSDTTNFYSKSPTNPGAGQGGGVAAIGSGGGGGGGHGTTGTNASYSGASGYTTNGGSSYDSADLTHMTLGSGGGGANQWEQYPGNSEYGGSGGNGGGIIFITGASIIVTGNLNSNGQNGYNSTTGGTYGGGGGAGGAILLKSYDLILGSSLVTAVGGQGGTGDVGHIYSGSPGGSGGSGYVVATQIINVNTTTLPNAVGATPYSQTLIASGGTGSYTWSMPSGNLPDGFSLNANTGVISGQTVLAYLPSPHQYSFTVQVTDSANDTATQQLSITVTCPRWDINDDGICNYLDLTLLGIYYDQTGTPGWIPEDINQDGVINYLDLTELGIYYGDTW